jgi:signal transduction histidine kinase
LKTTIQNKQRQEQKLDEAQKMLQQILKQVRTNVTDYRWSDIRKLETAIIALDQVTLRTDI